MKKWINIITGLTSIAVLALNLALLQSILSGTEEVADSELADELVLHISRENGILMLSLFLVTAVSGIALALLLKHEKASIACHLVYAVLSLASCTTLLICGDTPEAFRLATVLYMSAMAISRIIAVISGKSKLNIIPAVLLIISCALLWISPAVIVILGLLIIDIQAIVHVVQLTFSRIRMDILKKIVRRTYAAEILLGIVLLIIAFSLFMPLFEDGISNFPDALWYCFAIVTTIGFGDIYATSAVGRIMSVILGIYGIIVVALVTSVIVNFYGELKKEDEGGNEDEE